MTAAPLAPYSVSAYNTAHDSENKIHDDATARRFGFGGGLVPGVDVYGYMTHMPVARWGRAWLERGTAECRFFKPVYDGEPRNHRRRAEDELRSRSRAAASAVRPAAPHLPANHLRAGPRFIPRRATGGRRRPTKPRWRSAPGSGSIPIRSRRNSRPSTAPIYARIFRFMSKKG
jgi:hypothetical protein